MHLLLGLCLLFFLSKCRRQYHCLPLNGKCLYPPVSLLIFPSAAFQMFPFLFLFCLSLYDFISLTTLHSEPADRFLQHFNRALKITIFFFYSHWLCYNAATLRGQSRGQSIISPLPIQAAVCSSVPNRDKPQHPLSAIQSPH